MKKIFIFEKETIKILETWKPYKKTKKIQCIKEEIQREKKLKHVGLAWMIEYAWAFKKPQELGLLV
jgi:hypothetical protein